MKYYNEFNQRFLGSTDIGTINVFTNNGLHQIATGEDSLFRAYWINEEAIIGDRYKLIYEVNDVHYLIVSDELSINIKEEYTDGTVFKSKILKIYKAGVYRYIFQILDYTGD